MWRTELLRPRLRFAGLPLEDCVGHKPSVLSKRQANGTYFSFVIFEVLISSQIYSSVSHLRAI